MPKISSYRREAHHTSQEYRELQEQVAISDKQNPKQEAERAMQAGARKYPEPPLKAQHLEKPGLMGNKDLLDYSLTKGGIHAFTRSLATHLIPKGIRVNAVAPGPVWTPLNPADKEAKDVTHFGESTPMKRPAQPEEIAPAYVFLASSHCSSYITGEILPIIGGYSGG